MKLLGRMQGEKMPEAARQTTKAVKQVASEVVLLQWYGSVHTVLSGTHLWASRHQIAERDPSPTSP